MERGAGVTTIYQAGIRSHRRKKVAQQQIMLVEQGYTFSVIKRLSVACVIETEIDK